mmetsp:Transcript_85630/g.275442  ORF Transcript_85630/g.275442 Transcript_85630/m.275442 type:complete len:80 (+) Transcript_85630:34-273(+)
MCMGRSTLLCWKSKSHLMHSPRGVTQQASMRNLNLQTTTIQINERLDWCIDHETAAEQRTCHKCELDPTRCCCCCCKSY